MYKHKPWLAGTNIRPESKVRGNLPLNNSELEGWGVISGNLLMIEDKGCIFVEYTILDMIIIYYGDITPLYRADDVTMKSTYYNVLYLFMTHRLCLLQHWLIWRKSWCHTWSMDSNFSKRTRKKKSLYLSNNATRLTGV